MEQCAFVIENDGFHSYPGISKPLQENILSH
jgi:hypothetical protein